ncbi:uncharacterized protein LOC118756523, partial [Rhagoletis pomonella]|uniref:uncharacterized protein LOC118756523 n=1 Tax=Rhagoletis pomonella TaxID=28610 RepID=UPI00177C6CE2
MDADELMTLTVNGLKDKLRELGISTSGQKRELQDRLLQHYGLSRNEASDNESNQSVYNDVEESNNLLPSRSFMHQQQFTLKDLGDCISPFTGEGSVDIKFWVNEFEMNAAIVKWNDLQKFVYGKQLLRGAAKLFIKSQSNVNSWVSLKTALINEFCCKLSSSEVHKILKNRRKNANETFREYLYNIIEIGKQINLEEASIIDYFIEGIPDSKFNKTVLYQAKSVEDLKEQVKIYEKIRRSNVALGKVESNDTAKDKGSSGVKPKAELVKRCFKCGDKAHMAAQCSQKQFKCFKCNEMGHRSFECKGKGSKETKKEPSSVNTLTDEIFQPFLNSVKSELHFKTVKINDFSFEALIDSGCSLNLIRYDTLLMSGCETKLGGDKKKLYTACANVIETIGSFETLMHVDNLSLNIVFHVVREQDIQFAGMIGKAILKDVDIILTDEEVLFKKKDSAGKPIFKDSQATADAEKFKLDSKEVSLEKSEDKQGWIQEFDVMNLTEMKDKPTLNLEYLGKSFAKAVESLVSAYAPAGNCPSPVKMQIVLSDEIPVYQRPRRMPFDDRRFVDKQIEEWLQEGIIQPSSSNYASPIVVVPKKDGKTPTGWYKHIDRVQQFINKTSPRSTKQSPFKILTGLEMRTANMPELQDLLEDAAVDELNEDREVVRKEAKENILKIQEEN